MAPKTVAFSAPECGSMPPLETPGHSHAWLAQSLVGPRVHKVLFVPFKSLFPHSCGSFYNQIPLASKLKFPGGSHSLCQIPRLGNLL